MPQLESRERHVMLVLAASALELESLVVAQADKKDLAIARTHIAAFAEALAGEPTEEGRRRQTRIHQRHISDVLNLKRRRGKLAIAVRAYCRRIDMDRFTVDADAVFAGAPCLCELSELCRWIDNRVRQHYASEVGQPPPPIAYEAHRPVTTGGSGFPEGFHINGATDVLRPPARVLLTFKKNHLDLRTLRQCIYVLFHESICHAYQSPDDPTRSNADDTCDWSDGWMDAVAWQMTKRAINAADDESLRWISGNPSDTTDACRDLHRRRFQLPMPRMDEDDMELRVRARLAFKRLHQLWAGKSMALAEEANHLLLRFSLLLNHARMTVADRAELCSNLVRLLLIQENEAIALRCAHDCRAYTLDPTLQKLLTALRRPAVH